MFKKYIRIGFVGFCLLILVGNLYGQEGKLMGFVIDEKTKDPIPFAILVLEQNGKQLKGIQTDSTGYFELNNISLGIYEVRVWFIGYSCKLIENFEFIPYTTYSIIINLSQAAFDKELYKEGEVYPILILDKNPAPSGQTFSSSEIQKMAW